MTSPTPPTNSGQQVASEPPEFDAEGQADFDAIDTMLTEATKHRLQVEVVHSFDVSRASGSDVLTACREALYEWDI
jgi:hypothetical protein